MGLASPSIFFEEGCYRFYGIRNDRADIGMYTMSSSDGLIWSPLTRCAVELDKETDMWHGTVIHHNGIYHYVWVGKNGVPRNRIYHAKSQNGMDFAGTKVILKNDAGWESLYRPALLMDENEAYLYYGVVRCDGKWMVALSHGPDLEHLKGTTDEEVHASPERISKTAKLSIKRGIKDISSLIVPRMLVVVPVLFLMCFVWESTWLNWGMSIVINSLCYYIRFNREKCLKGGVVMGTVCSAIAVYLYQLSAELLELLL